MMKQHAIEIVKKLQNAGYEAVFAGGCVRDMLLNRTPHDIDIATSAEPQEVELLFEKTVPVGKSFGVVRVLVDGFEFEVATFRMDGNYSDGRRPDNVEFCSMEEDAKRRDFTINGMFYDPVAVKLLDFVGGEDDLDNGVLKFIGKPALRIKEDKLRLLRALRFQAQLGFEFELEAESWKAVVHHAAKVKEVSVERVFEELTKMFLCKHPAAVLRQLQNSTLLVHLLPEVGHLINTQQGEQYHPEGDVFEHTCLVMVHTPPDPVLRWSALLHDIGKPNTYAVRKHKHTFYGHESVGAVIADKMLRRFKCSNEFKANVISLVKSHMYFFNMKQMKKHTLKRFFRQPFYQQAQMLHRADLLGSCGDLTTYHFAVKKFAELCETLNPPPVLSGYDLIVLGYKPGPTYRQILTAVENQQLSGKLTTYEEAVQFVQDNWEVENDELSKRASLFTA